MVLMIFRKKFPICFYSFKLIWSMVFRHFTRSFLHISGSFSLNFMSFSTYFMSFSTFFILYIESWGTPLISCDSRLQKVLVPMGSLYVGLSWPIWSNIIIILGIISRIPCYFRPFGDAIWLLLGNWTFHDF